jgi:hypothetical protein
LTKAGKISVIFHFISENHTKINCLKVGNRKEEATIQSKQTRQTRQVIISKPNNQNKTKVSPV